MSLAWFLFGTLTLPHSTKKSKWIEEKTTNHSFACSDSVSFTCRRHTSLPKATSRAQHTSLARQGKHHEKTHPQKQVRFLEVPPGFEPGNNGFADRCLTTCLWYRMDQLYSSVLWSQSMSPYRPQGNGSRAALRQDLRCDTGSCNHPILYFQSGSSPGVFHLPFVKSGNATGTEPFAMDCADRAVIAIQTAVS